jgi:hypothetical protein
MVYFLSPDLSQLLQYCKKAARDPAGRSPAKMIPVYSDIQKGTELFQGVLATSSSCSI